MIVWDASASKSARLFPFDLGQLQNQQMQPLGSGHEGGRVIFLTSMVLLVVWVVG